MGEVYKTIRNAFVGTATPYYVESNKDGYFYLESNNIKDGVINRIKEIFINEEFYLSQRDKWLYEGDLVMVQSGHVGHTAVIPKELNETAAHALIIFQNQSKPTDPHFLNYELQTTNSKKMLDNITIGNTIKHILASDMKEFKVSLPNKIEQTAIGNFFRTLDNTILLYKRKLDGLKQLKKAYLQQMFPQEGETVPKVRFTGFKGDWEMRKLGEISTFRRGSFPQPYGNAEWYDEDNGMPFVQVVDVGNDLRLVDDTKQKISELAQHKSVYVPTGKVIVTLQGSIGRVAITQYPAFVDRTLLIFDDYKLSTDIYYWAYVVQQKFDIEKKTAPGGTIKTITKEVLSKFEIALPVIAEQTAIGNFFRNLDEQIATQQTKLDNLKQLKSAYLHKMFV